MTTIRRHLTYANVAATLALVFSMSAGAIAGTHYLINSTKQINPKVLAKLKGRRGPTGRTGATGLPGLPGAPGPPGPSATVFNTNSENSSLAYPLKAEQELTVASLNLPAGVFSVLGKLTVDDDPPSKESVATCRLVLGTTTIDPDYYGQSVGPAPNDRATVVLSGVGKLFAPGTASIVCKTNSISGKYLNRVITATQVGSVG